MKTLDQDKIDIIGKSRKLEEELENAVKLKDTLKKLTERNNQLSDENESL